MAELPKMKTHTLTYQDHDDFLSTLENTPTIETEDAPSPMTLAQSYEELRGYTLAACKIIRDLTTALRGIDAALNQNKTHDADVANARQIARRYLTDIADAQ